MTDDDPLRQLRRQLVDAADRRAEQHSPAASRPRRWRRRGTIFAVATVLVGVPAAAAATGVISVGRTGTAPDGSTFTTGQITDNQASTDPKRRDGVGRTCDTTEVRSPDGKLVTKGKACRPRGARDTAKLSVGFDLLPDGFFLIRGSVDASVQRVDVSGQEEPVKLTRGPEDGRKSFTLAVPDEPLEVVASDGSGREIARKTVNR